MCQTGFQYALTTCLTRIKIYSQTGWELLIVLPAMQCILFALFFLVGHILLTVLLAIKFILLTILHLTFALFLFVGHILFIFVIIILLIASVIFVLFLPMLLVRLSLQW